MSDLDRWIVLNGTSADLDVLVDQIDFESVSIRREGNEVQMRSTEFETFAGQRGLRNLECEVVQHVNLVARFLCPSFTGVSAGPSYTKESDGRVFVSISAQATGFGSATLSGVIVRADGSIVEPEITIRNGEGLLKVIREDPSANYILDMSQNHELSPSSCYHLYESVRSEVGGDSVIAEQGWASENEIERFTRSVNSKEVFGQDARHGHVKFEPPKNPMTIRDCRTFVRGLVENYIRWKMGE